MVLRARGPAWPIPRAATLGGDYGGSCSNMTGSGISISLSVRMAGLGGIVFSGIGLRSRGPSRPPLLPVGHSFPALPRNHAGSTGRRARDAPGGSATPCPWTCGPLKGMLGHIRDAVYLLHSLQRPPQGAPGHDHDY